MENLLLLSDIAALFPKSEVHGNGAAAVLGLSRDSRSVQPGQLFVCIRGAEHDSHRYATDALARGASGLVVNTGDLERVGIVVPDSTFVLTVKDTRAALPIIACAYYGNPSHRMTMVGVTGTNGKTTTTRMVAAILRAAGRRVGTIGTLGAEIDGAALDSEHTTPEADQLQKILAQMRDLGADAVVMEVSSHALAMHRTDEIAFNAAIFCNLSQDHLDFHKTMGDYFDAKAQLFSRYPVAYPRPDGSAFIAVITISQWEGRELVTLARGDVLTFATDDSPSVLRAEDVVLAAESVKFRAVYDSGIEKYDFPIELPIGGAFQVGNALGATGACLRLGVSRQTIADGLAALPPVPGRFESVPTGGHGFSVIVDYAHTPDGLENLLRSARDLRPSRIIAVFGCGGNRDRTKRPRMGRLAATLADVAIVTSDNPRHEPPNEIIEEILTGMDPNENPDQKAVIIVEPDRRAAIAIAINMASERDMVLIAGKGHETYQLVGDAVLEFDDRTIAGELLAARSVAPRDSRFGRLLMEQFALTWAAAVTRAKIVGEPSEQAMRAVCIDSRKAGPGMLFFALRGENADGHAYVPDALKSGAVAVVSMSVSVPDRSDGLNLGGDVPGTGTVLVVADPLLALGALAHAYRSQFAVKMVGITGSVGKTSVKEMAAHVLRTRFQVLANEKNYNTEIGVPITLFGLNPGHEVAVVEMGMRARGEIRTLAAMARPNIAIITNVGHAHVELLGSQRAVAETKSEILELLPADGVAILPYDLDYNDVVLKALPAGCRVVRVGHSGADLWAEDSTLRQDSSEITFAVHHRDTDKSATVSLKAPGHHNVSNALFALAAAIELGVPLCEAAAALGTWTGAEGRMTVRTGLHNVTVLDDCYNAGPESMKAALKTLGSFEGARVAILGDMRELGAYAPELHEKVGKYVAGADLRMLVTVGPLAALIADNALSEIGQSPGSVRMDIVRVDSTEECEVRLEDLIRHGDVVLVKGSRAMRMERIVARLTGEQIADHHG